MRRICWRRDCSALPSPSPPSSSGSSSWSSSSSMQPPFFTILTIVTVIMIGDRRALLSPSSPSSSSLGQSRQGLAGVSFCLSCAQLGINKNVSDIHFMIIYIYIIIINTAPLLYHHHQHHNNNHMNMCILVCGELVMQDLEDRGARP